jgi:Zn-dependent metalloprotease
MSCILLSLRRYVGPLAAILLVMLSLTAIAQAQSKLKSLDPAGLKRLEAETGATITLHPSTGAARFVRLSERIQGSMAPAGVVSPRDKAAAFFAAYGSVFGIRNPQAELKLGDTMKEKTGEVHLTYQQVYNGVPVFGAILKAHFDRLGRLRVVNGTFIPSLNFSVRPSRTAEEAAAVALIKVTKDMKPSTILTANTKRLLVFREGLARGVAGDSHLAYEVEVGNGGDVREFVFVDAHTNIIIDQLSGIQDAMDRRAFDGNYQSPSPLNYPAFPYWVEGDPRPVDGTTSTSGVCVTGGGQPPCNTEAENMVQASQETYDLYFNTFGRDSFDAAGATMDSVFDRGYSCPNASWNGTFISFCAGTTTDDVTAHEWSHAYTQYTDGLIYAWQPGALNESYSDIFGETVDQTNGRGTDTPNAARTGLCSSFSPPRGELVINTPPVIAGNNVAQAAAFGPALSGVGVTGAIATTTPTDGCSAIAESLTGKIAIIDRGTCTFTVKVKNAQLKGAIAVVIANNASTGLPGMGGADGTITIPSLGVTQQAGASIRSQMPVPGVNVTLHTTAGATDSSVLWLMGEDASAFSGAIRDMSNPNCYSNPGKVSDFAFYVCSTADGGGVHTNSGVPNHGYQLTADGGTYNGQTITGLGLLKAAHIYFRAMDVYQVPDTDFTDHADAIEQSCSDLIGVPLTGFDGLPSGQTISAANCTELHKVTLAVEMRVPPSFCGFLPMLAKTPPPVCGTGGTASTVYSFDFETDPFTSGWTVNNVGVYPAVFTPRDWVWTASVPAGGTGSAVFGIDYPFGDCNPLVNDQSGAIRLESPSIAIPVGVAPILSFDHWMASEVGWDGGNLKVSTNGGGTWTLVPSSAFRYNAYNATMITSGSGNTSPLAGQVGYSGADGGSVNGSWGKSIVNLSGLVSPGSSVILRYEFGQDGCGANYGWFVDNVAISSCVPAIAISDVSVAEGNSGTVNANFIVTLSAPSAQTVTVNYSTANGTATGGDYGATGFAILSFAPGTTSKTISVPVIGDTANELDETFFVNLAGAVNATIYDNQGQGTITNDDALPSLSMNDVSVTEGNSGTTNAIFTATLSAASGLTVTVNYGTSSGTASAGSDFTVTSGALSFAPGITTRTITVPVLGDTNYEPNENYKVVLNSPANASLLLSEGQGTIVNDDSCPTITLNDTLSDGVVGTAYPANSIVASGGAGPYNYVRTAGTLPTGLTLNTNGTVTGTPTAAGTFTFTVMATDANGCNGVNSTYSVTIVCPTITLDDTLTDGTVGTAYPANSIVASGGNPAYTYAVTAGTFPTGLTLNTNGTVTGTPTAAGTFTFTVTATDVYGCTGVNSTYSVEMVCPTITLDDTLPDGTVGTAYPANSIIASGGNPAYTYAVTAGTFPTGLTLNTNGTVTGTPTAAGTFTFTVTATDVYGCTGENSTYSVEMVCPTITLDDTLSDGVAGTAYPANSIIASGGTAAYTYAVTDGTFPTGLTLNTDGTILGTPTAAGTFTFEVTATDANGCEGVNSSYSVDITCPTITLDDTLPDVTAGTNYAGNSIIASDGTAPYTYAVTAGTFPTGLTLNSNGAITGTTTAPGTFTFTVTATDANGCTGVNSTYSVTVTCIFCDDFSDNNLTTPFWTVNSGSWSAATGDAAVTVIKKGELLSPAFTCTNCSFESRMKISAGGRISLYGWFANSNNSLQIRLQQDKQSIFIQQKSGSLSRKATASFTILPNTFYDVKVTFNGTNFQVTVDGTPVPGLTILKVGTPSGAAKFFVKSPSGASVTGTYAELLVY